MGVFCVYMHTQTHTAHGVLEYEPRGRDKTPGRPEESRWTKSRHICMRICTQSTHVCILGGGMRFWSSIFFFPLKCFFFRKRKAKLVNVKPKTQIRAT